LKKLRYTYNNGEYLRKLRDEMPFADGGLLASTLTKEIEAELGPKTADDDKMIENKKKEAKNEAKAKKEEKKVEANNEEEKEVRGKIS